MNETIKSHNHIVCLIKYSFDTAQQSCDWLLNDVHSPHYIFHCVFKIAGINICGDHMPTKLIPSERYYFYSITIKTMKIVVPI